MNIPRAAIVALSTFAFVAAWALTSAVVGAPFILPGPIRVISDIGALVLEPGFRSQAAATLYRGILAFAVSASLSLLIGCLSGVSAVVDAAVQPWLTVVKSTPVVSFILIALLWFGSSFVPVFVSILMTLPVMTEALARGIRETDPKLLEMARIYRFKKLNMIFDIQLRSALPFFLAGAGSALGLTWKVVVAGEILGLPRDGLGTAIQTARVQLESARVLSLTVMAIGMSVASEALFSFLSRRMQVGKTLKVTGTR